MKDLKQKVQSQPKTLYDKLDAYGQSDFYPYHMPGHKRNNSIGIPYALAEAFKIDITEIDGFDNLHHPEGILKQAQERAAKLYGAEETFFLVNGSTCGILAAISAAADLRDTILIARNCHRSVYHAACLQLLKLCYLYPKQIAEYGISDAVNPADVEKALEQYPECKAVVITSPTYEGIVSDIEAISEIVHRKDKILIVDEAHGAHFGLADNMPENAVKQGADIVIHGLHKTLLAMTQTALLHVNGQRVNREKLRRYLSIYQSSSPSYVLMASIDACISDMEKHAAIFFQKMEKYYKNFIEQMKTCRHIRIGREDMIAKDKYYFTAWDIGKLVISGVLPDGKQINGQYLYDILRNEFHLQMEMAADNYVLAMMTIADEEEGWQRLADALRQIDDRIEEGTYTIPRTVWSDPSMQYGIVPTVKMSIAEAVDKAQSGRKVLLSEAEGEVSGEFINLYPPGIPFLVPGEVIDISMIGRIQTYLQLGFEVQGVSDAGTVTIC
ncbi:MAG: aminotransferase class V-fold PLP-dependent enzyme [Lachnospiraceae bacterium]|nr:aminotransferase class V-fold PLP-dependent enzyme [Lachnospiraceae bacterium]